jgi:Carboxypeptidase regulatory-like domain
MNSSLRTSVNCGRLTLAGLCLTAGLLAQTVSVAGTGNVTGTVADDSGAAVEGALVTVFSMPTTTAATMKPVAVTAASGTAGAFQITGLPPGRYEICVNKPAANLLDPCTWADGLPWVTGSTLIAVANVTAGTTASGIKAVAIRGVPITVRVADATDIIGQNGGRSDILIGIRHGGAPFISAGQPAADAAGKTYSLVVPAGKTTNISAYSKAFVLADQNGKEFATSEVSLPAAASAITAAAPAAGATNSNAGTIPSATITLKISRPATAAGPQ